ncbi:hypothetical protein ABPG75_007086 [Micractinium tetrahymenae]
MPCLPRYPADECRDEDFLLPPEVLRELHAEAAIMVRMRHPHIVQFMGICALSPCLVTEYCARGSVFSVLQEGRRSEARARELAWPLRLRMLTSRRKVHVHKHTPPARAHLPSPPCALCLLRWQALDAAKGLLYLHKHTPPIIHRKAP